jgi:tryptophan synthase beta chain
MHDMSEQHAKAPPVVDDYLGFPDARGHFGPYGGSFVAETLMRPLRELAEAYDRYRRDPEFLSELDADLKHYVGRPSPIYHARRLSARRSAARRSCSSAKT